MGSKVKPEQVKTVALIEQLLKEDTFKTNWDSINDI